MKENIFMSSQKDTAPLGGWFTEQQACSYLGISRTTLYRLRQNGEIAFSKYHRILRYRREDLDRLLLDNYVETIRPP